MSETLYGRFAHIARTYPRNTALMFRKEGAYTHITYGDLDARIRALAGLLSSWGVVRGDAVGILSYNRPEWVICDFAAMKLGAIVVPIYHTLPAPTIKYIVNDSSMKVLFVENAALGRLVDGIKAECPALNRVVRFDDPAFAAATAKTAADLPPPETADTAASADDLASFVYTTGTTGEPKGVMLTHANILSNALAGINRFKVTPGDTFLSFLPLCHLFERTAGHYTHLLSGGTVAYVENLGTIARDAAEVKPTVMIAVPRVLEMGFDKVAKSVRSGPFLRKALVWLAVQIMGRRQALIDAGKWVAPWLSLPSLLLDALVGRKMRAIAGGRLRAFVAGGAPLDKTIGWIMRGLGFPLMEGYGLTETSPIAASGMPGDSTLGTVGKPLDGVNIRIADNGEILIKGPNVMRGYLNKPEDTARVLDADGWFHTGDEGQFDARGNLMITGRIKELIVTSNGKKVAPVPIEGAIARSRYVDQVVVYGDKRKHVVALIVPVKDEVRVFARSRGLDTGDYDALLRNDAVRELYRHELEQATADLPAYEKPKGFALLADSFTVENGMMTPAMKLKRGKVIEKYMSVIEGLYS